MFYKCLWVRVPGSVLGTENNLKDHLKSISIEFSFIQSNKYFLKMYFVSRTRYKETKRTQVFIPKAFIVPELPASILKIRERKYYLGASLTQSTSLC